jgi:hypothetical protein
MVKECEDGGHSMAAAATIDLESTQHPLLKVRDMESEAQIHTFSQWQRTRIHISTTSLRFPLSDNGDFFYHHYFYTFII